MKKGLILEGGAMRGMFTCGVLDVFMENQVIPDGAVGVSAGASFGCNIKSRQHGRALRYNLKYARDWRFSSMLSLVLTGDLYGAKFDYEILPNELDVWDADTFAKNPMEFYCVATNVKNGKALYHKCSDGGERDLKWIRGSASMPLVSRPVKVDGFELLDGGISDSIPLTFFENIGYDRNVLILTQPKDYEKKPFDKKMQFLLKTSLEKKSPALYEALEHRYQKYNETLALIKDKEEKGEIFVIRPEAPLNIGSVCHDPDEKQRVYDEGRKAAYEALKKVKTFYQDEK